jgi:hypothetical protein
MIEIAFLCRPLEVLTNSKVIGNTQGEVDRGWQDKANSRSPLPSVEKACLHIGLRELRRRPQRIVEMSLRLFCYLFSTGAAPAVLQCVSLDFVACALAHACVRDYAIIVRKPLRVLNPTLTISSWCATTVKNFGSGRDDLANVERGSASLRGRS